MDSDMIFNSLANIRIAIDNNKDEIEKLDQKIGDGDHIFNIQRGITEALEMREVLNDEKPKDILKKIGLKIMTTIGGSSGALFATLLMAMAKKFNESLNDQENVAEMFLEGVNAMKKRGKSDIGEKTMLDVLIPVSKILIENKSERDISVLAKSVIEAAKNGMLSTKNMIATKGRASFLGERAKGHVDPGARSSQLAIEAICNQFIK
tara:strand:+ start:1279 stop:1899 length:621 start_codon:yes stop_codon:yes gene_type:complete